MKTTLVSRLMSFGALLALLSSCAGDDCTASCEGKDPGEAVQNPQDCHQYYGCLADGNTTDTPFTCNDGYYYHTSFEECYPEFDDPCKSTCPLLGCALTCQKDLVFLSYPGDCTKYRVCTPDGGLVDAQCSSEVPYFDGVTCQTDPAQCCDPCIVKCFYGGTEIVDPYDCHSFYFCDNFLSYVRSSCEIGMHFDPIEAKCVSGIQCENICPLSQSTTVTATETTTPATTTVPATTTTTTTTTKKPDEV